MKVELQIDKNSTESKFIIITNRITREVEKIINFINSNKHVTYKGTKDQQIYLLNPDDIFYFYTEGQRVMVKTKNQVLQVKLKLYEIEEQMDGTNLIRISNSIIANIDKINNLEMSFNGTFCIKFINGDIQYSSRRYVKKIKEFLNL
ncbi:LytTR family DNA-binding domain-containing protein [Clostridium grantii]|uniref:LytTr DNA-binding domain-containing protein n=1 Tax=Clostridium grantii DSM 8605 TaxID=1121316 RepID=A0A1M5SP79_9CLOT|nr:LytTR family DNA-binding domain-containing protein [Clostridium grantii]SHH39753.1 LytTr DNA-binding domain-containing protein [Clostridium grantii DSM 8605]